MEAALAGVIYGVHHPSTWAVVVPSFNHADDAIICLGSLWNADPRPGRVVFVDDASTDDAVTRVAQWAEDAGVDYRVVPSVSLQQRVEPRTWLTIATSNTNAGFVHSSNLGLRYVRDFTRAPFALLLNNDAAVTPDYFAELSKALARAPETGTSSLKRV